MFAPDRASIEIALEAAPFAIQHIVAKYLSGQDTEGRHMITKHPGLFFRDRSAWRAWLRAHHTQATEAWVAHVKKDSHRQGLAYEDGVQEALCFGWIDGLTHSLDADFFLQRYTPRKPGSLWSESNTARVQKLIRERRMARAGMRHVEAAQADGRWQAATQRQDPSWIPEPLQAALALQPGALEAFRALPPSQRQMYGYAVESAKRPDTRAKRIQAAIDAAVHRHTSRQQGSTSPRRPSRRKGTSDPG